MSHLEVEETDNEEPALDEAIAQLEAEPRTEKWPFPQLLSWLEELRERRRDAVASF